MAEIDKKNVLDDNVKKAFEDLTGAIGGTLQVMVKLTDEAQKASAALNGGNITQLSAQTKQYNESLKLQASAEREVIKLEQDKVKLSEANRKATEAGTKAAEKQTNQLAQSTSLYAQHSKALTEARYRAKDLALQYGENSKQFKNAAKEVANMDSKLKSIDGKLGQHQRNVGNYGKAFSGAAKLVSGFAFAIGGGMTALQAFSKVIGSSQTTADAFAEIMQGVGSAVEYTATAMANGNFKDFFNGLAKAYQAGKAYAAALDELEDRQRAVNVTTSKNAVFEAEQRKIYQDATKSKVERISAIDKVIAKDKEEAESRQRINKSLYEEELKKVFATESALGELTDARKESFEFFLSEREAQRESVELAQSLIEMEEGLLAVKTRATSTANGVSVITVKDNEAREQARKNIDALIVSLGGEDSAKVKSMMQWKELLKTYTISDEKLNTLVQKYGAYQQSTADIINAEGDLMKKRSGLIAGLEKQSDKIADATYKGADLIKIKEEEIKVISETEAKTKLEVEMRNNKIRAIQKEIDLLKELGKPMDKMSIKTDITGLDPKEFLKTAEDNAAKEFKIFASNEEYKTKLLEDEEQKRQEIREQAAQFSADAVMGISDMLFENAAIKRDEEAQAELAAMDYRLENEKLDDEQRAALEKQRDKRERKMKRDAAKADKERAIFQIGISTAMAVMQAYAQLGPIAGTVAVPFILAGGALQAALVSARKIPAYFKGTSNHGGGPALVGDGGGGSEMVIEPTGKRYLTPATDTIIDLPRGSQVIPGKDVADKLTEMTREEMVRLSIGMPKQNAQNDYVAKLIAEEIKTRKAIVNAVNNNKPQDVRDAVAFEVKKMSKKL